MKIRYKKKYPTHEEDDVKPGYRRIMEVIRMFQGETKNDREEKRGRPHKECKRLDNVTDTDKRASVVSDVLAKIKGNE